MLFKQSVCSMNNKTYDDGVQELFGIVSALQNCTSAAAQMILIFETVRF